MTPQIIYDDDVTVAPFLLINNQHSNSSSSLDDDSVSMMTNINYDDVNDEKLIKILQRKSLGTNELFVYGDEECSANDLIADFNNQEEQVDHFVKLPHKNNRMNAFSKGGVLCRNNMIENQVKSIKSSVLDIDENIEKIESGSWHTVILTNKNRIFAMGKNLDSQLNIQNTIHPTTAYRHVLKFCFQDSEIKDIACGKRNTMILMQDGQVYGVGYNIYGQIGCQTTTTATEYNNSEESDEQDSNNNCRVNTLSKTKIDEKVKLLACGSYHTIMITRSNGVYFCGEMYGGVDIKIPSRLTFFDTCLDDNDYVTFVSCGELHSVFLSRMGKVYALGRNSYGQLGLQDFKSRPEITIIDHFANQPISMVACGWNHTLFLTRNNQLYCSGRNKHGQLGVGDYVDRNIPTRVNIGNNNDDECIISIHAGRACSVFETKKRNFYITGSNYCEKIEGHDISVPQRILLPNSFLQNPCFNYQIFTSSKSRTLYLTKKENARLVWTFARMKRRVVTEFYTDITIIVHSPKPTVLPPPEVIILNHFTI